MITTNNFKSKNCELHEVLRRPMLICRAAGLFPVEGLNHKDFTVLRFNLKSLYAAYYFATLLGQIIVSSFVIFFFFTHDIALETIKCLLFYLNGLMSMIFLLKMAKKWPQLMKKASYLESRVTNLGTKIKRYDLVAFAVLLLGSLEHSFSILFQVKSVEICFHKRNIDLDYMKHYYSRLFIFDLTPYIEWKAVLYQMVNFQSTFLWNFTDTITMCVSLYLTSYFKHLNKLIEKQQKQNLVNWKEMRLYYSYLVELVNEVDQSICYLISISFFINLFFVCVQLFHLTNYEYPELPYCTEGEVITLYSSTEHFLYYTFSFVFLFVRISLASLLAANINTVAKRPLVALQNVSPTEYSIEVQRFIRQIRYTTTALSGVFFYITREMILTVIATVIKYELMILQFSSIY